MRKNFILFLLFLLIIELIEARKRKLKIGKKVKRLFVAKKHHHKSKPKPRTVISSTRTAQSSIFHTVTAALSTFSTSISASASSITPTSILQPTATTFNANPVLAVPAPTPTEVFITVTDRNYNYFLGYPTPLSGVHYYKNPRFMIAGRRPCGCCDNKIIIVTRAADERLI